MKNMMKMTMKMKMKMMIIMVVESLMTMSLANAQTGDTGFFWHITDMHYDPTYNSSGPGGVSCGGRQGALSGAYGSYLCDSPWKLIRSSVQAMKELQADVDFIIWTGDDTPHNANNMSADGVAEIIGNLTEQLLLVFPNTTLFPVLGNHDWSPKSQIPPRNDSFYATVAALWAPWLTTPTANETFCRSGFYSIQLNDKVLLVGLNTNLYYDSNKITATMVDPGNQLQWLDDTLTAAANDGHKVILIGHVPPGQFEKHETKHWFYPHYNQLFVGLLRKHSNVFGSIHFGHHHTDSFRLFYNDQGVTTGSFFIAPAVTPWETTLPGVMGGAGNNPGVRLIEYIRDSGAVVNIRQYYLNLTAANEATAEGKNVSWTIAYDAKELFGLQDMSPASLKTLVDQMWTSDDLFNRYYQINGLYFDPNEKWTPDYRVVHCCAIEELDYTNYTNCINEHTVTTSGASTVNALREITPLGGLTLAAMLVSKCLRLL